MVNANFPRRKPSASDFRMPAPRVRLGRTELSVSPLGFGGYRVHDRDPCHRAALELALDSGVNLIDTSTNYGDGASELLVGQTLRARARRDTVVVTKIGYAQGENLRLAEAREREGRPFPEMVKYQPDCWHAISPEFLADQLDRSLHRLGIPRIDVLLLHNPEYFLKAGGNHADYYERIRRAFEHLETECDRGRIQYYGVSSNSLPESRESPEFTSLELLWEAAEAVSRSHRFGVIQFPFNLYESGAATEVNNGPRTITQLARELGLGTLINRPLNAYTPAGKLVRLADFPEPPATRGPSVAERLNAQMEAALNAETLARPATPWAHTLKDHFDRFHSLDHWRQFLHWRIEPALAEAGEPADSPLRRWLETATEYFATRAHFESRSLARHLDLKTPALAATPSLARKALRVYRAFPGIDCVLAGMRRPEYVRDLVASFADTALPEEEALRAMATLPAGVA